RRSARNGPAADVARGGMASGLQPGRCKHHVRLQRQVTRIAACLYDAASAHDLPVIGSPIKMGEQTRNHSERHPWRFAGIKRHTAPADESDRNCRVLGAANVELRDIGALVRTYVLHIKRHRDAWSWRSNGQPGVGESGVGETKAERIERLGAIYIEP